VDYSGQFPGVAALKGAGVSGVLRYVGGDGGKHLSAAEARACLAAGIDVGGVNETTADRALAGYGAGYIDARDGLADLSAKLGRPARCIGLAVDFDASQAQLTGPIHQYFRGGGAAVGVGRLKGYGGYRVVAYLLDNKLVSYAWQAFPWGPQDVHGLQGRRQDPRAHLFQNYPGRRIGGTDCDVNTILRADYGQTYAVPPEEISVSDVADIITLITAFRADVMKLITTMRAEAAGRYKVDAGRYKVDAGRYVDVSNRLGALVSDVEGLQATVGSPAIDQLIAEQAQLKTAVANLVALITPPLIPAGVVKGSG